MKHIRTLPPRSRWRMFALVAIPVLGWAQTSEPDATHAWRQANDVVGQFRRGHIDLLKWEQAQPVARADAPPTTAVLALPKGESAVEQAWKRRSDLAATLNRLQSSDRALIASGQWEQLDPSLLRRTDGLSELLEFTAQVRKAWLQATASALALDPSKAALDASQLAYELGQRMVKVGNWSKLAQAPQQLAWANAQVDWHRTRIAAQQDQARLLKLLGLSGRYGALTLAQALPDTVSAPSRQQFDARLQQLRQVSGSAVGDRIQADASLAYEALEAARAVAEASASIVNIREMVVDETQLHYSGMLKSTWDLLAEVQNLAQAQIAALNAQRDAELARSDLNWVLLGGEPDAVTSVSISPTSAGGGGGGD